MQWARWLVAPLALSGAACSSWYRAGPQVRTLDGRVAAEGKVTVEGGVEQLLFPLAVSGGVTPDDGEDVFALETGGEYVSPIGDGPWYYVAGPRFVGMLSGPSGTSLGLNAGPFVELDPESGGDPTVLSLELFAGGGLSGDVAGGFVGGACLSIGTFHQGVFRVPSGRALRVGDRVITASAVERDDWIDAVTLLDLPEEERLREGRAWLAAALDEHASIAAFVRLRAELVALGAPESLVAGAERAARDEEAHARLCFSIASAQLGRAYGPGALPEEPGAPPSLARLAYESLVDGCFGEGLAARLAEQRSRRAADPAIVRALDTIARDEARHAELGHQTIAWCLRAGGAEVRAALDAGFARVASLASALGKTGSERAGETWDRLG